MFFLLLFLLQALETTKRYDNLAMQSKSISGQTDLMSFAKNMPVSANLMRVPKKMFASPQPHQDPSENPIDYNVSSDSLRHQIENGLLNLPINSIYPLRRIASCLKMK